MKLNSVIALSCLTMLSNPQAQQLDSLGQPKVIKFGAPEKTIKNKLKPLCDAIKWQRIDPPEIPGTEKSQTQLDCHGFHFAGKKRLAEFVFKDDALFLTWVLLEEHELPNIESQMHNDYGKANYTNPMFSAFTQYRTALRKDIPEVLFYSKAAAPQFESWFKSNQ